LTAHVSSRYSVEPDYPWQSDEAAVLRHPDSGKWFGVVMRVSYETLGVHKSGSTEILNLKCDPMLIGAVRTAPGILPAYHMNKEHWISVLLDGSAADNDILFLLEQSWNLTMPRRKGKSARKNDSPEEL